MNFWINVGFDIIFHNDLILYLFLNFLNMELLIIIVIFPILVNIVDGYVKIFPTKKTGSFILIKDWSFNRKSKYLY